MLIKDAIEEIKEVTGAKDQYEVADVIGTSQGTVSNYMKGRSYPTLEIAARIYNEFNIRCEPFTEWALQDYIEKYMQ